jgi:hypothetical protein
MGVIQGGMTPEVATEKSLKRAAEILAQHLIAQA